MPVAFVLGRGVCVSVFLSGLFNVSILRLIAAQVIYTRTFRSRGSQATYLGLSLSHTYVDRCCKNIHKDFRFRDSGCHILRLIVVTCLGRSLRM